jgi:hypothetical protein
MEHREYMTETSNSYKILMKQHGRDHIETQAQIGQGINEHVWSTACSDQNLQILSPVSTDTIITCTSIDLGSIPKPMVGLTLKADTIQWAGRSGTGTVNR